MSEKTSDYICAAQIGRAHGIKGNVHVTAFVEDATLLMHKDGVFNKDGAFLFHIEKIVPHKKAYMAKIENVIDRTGAELLRNKKLYIPRKHLPKLTAEDEFYHTDLIHIPVYMTDEDTAMGQVIAVHNFGAGDLLEIKNNSSDDHDSTFLLPFTKACVPDVDLQKKRITISPPDGFFDPATQPESENA